MKLKPNKNIKASKLNTELFNTKNELGITDLSLNDLFMYIKKLEKRVTELEQKIEN